MDAYLPFIITGIAIGSIYGLAATGLTLTYQTSGIFNFGYGALATAGAYLFYFLHVDHELPWWLSALIVVLVAGPVMGLVMERITARLAFQRTAWKIIGTTGLVLVMQGLGAVKYGTDPRLVDQFLPKGTSVFRFGGVNISYAQLSVTILSLVVVGGFWIVLKRSFVGLSMRAVVDDPDLVAMLSRNPHRIRRTAAMCGACLAVMSGVLILPFVGLDAIGLTLLVVQAFGAAAIGRFASVAMTFLGAIAIGVVANVTLKLVLGHANLAGLPSSIALLVLFLTLMLTPKHKLPRPSVSEARQVLPYVAPARARMGLSVVVVGALALVPSIVDSPKLPFFTIGLTQATMLLSLGLLVRTSGQVSLCHASFAAIGAVTFSQLSLEHGWPWFVALIGAGLVVVPIGALVAVSSIRLSGVYLALATFAFGIIVQQMFYARGFMFTTLSQGRELKRPSFAESQERYYYFVLAATVVVAALILVVQKARLGRLLLGLSESPLAIATMGLSTNVTRVIVFSFSALLASVAGVLYGATVHFANSGDVKFGFMTSLTLLAVLGLAPFGPPWFALFGILSAVLPGYLTSGTTTHWLNVVFGLFAVVTACEGGPPAMPPALRRFFDRLGGRRTGHDAAPPTLGERSTGSVATIARTGGLEVDGLGVRFGGLVAVDDVSFRAPTGRITGIIGPNGAGKTTLFDACSGINRRVTGDIRLHGEQIAHRSASSRARAGLGRTFQTMHLADSLSVAENVAMGIEAAIAGRNIVAQLVATPTQRRRTAEGVGEAIERCGLTDLADAQVGALSTGQRRLVEFARCLAGPFDVLLLDEPSSGLDPDETARFGTLLQEVVSERQCGILLVEHDMSLVMNVCSYIYVLDFGRLIFEGESSAVAASPLVRDAYLGAMPSGAQAVGT